MGSSASIAFLTEYRQFYIFDPSFELDTSSPSFWTPEASERGIAAGGGGLGISTASWGTIRAFVQVSEHSPTLPSEAWDRVVEGSVHVRSGRLVIASSTGFEINAEIVVPSGDYRVRVHEAFLDDEVEGTAGDQYYDMYWISIWPAPFDAVRTNR